MPDIAKYEIDVIMDTAQFHTCVCAVPRIGMACMKCIVSHEDDFFLESSLSHTGCL